MSLSVEELVSSYIAGEIELDELDESESALLFASWEADVREGYTDSRLKASPARIFRYPPKWLVHGLIPAEGIGQIYGASGSGKTYLALDLALSVANVDTTKWFGRNIRRHGQVIYIALEGTWNLQNRIQAWMQANNGSDSRLFTFEEESLDLTNSDSCLELLKDIRSADFLYRPIRPVLIVVDTQRLAMSGDENTEQATALARNVITIARELSCCVVMVHHEGYDDTHARGSTVVKDAISFQFHLKKDKKKQGVNGDLFLEKNKYGITPPLDEPIAAYQVNYIPLKPWNQLAHNFDDEFVKDEYGDDIMDGYCTEVAVRTKVQKVAEVIRTEPKDIDIVRELIESLDNDMASTGMIRKVLGGNSPQSKVKFDKLVKDGLLTERTRQGTTIFWSIKETEDE